MDWETAVFLQIKKILQIITIPYVHWRFIVYKALLIPQTSTEEETEAQITEGLA